MYTKISNNAFFTRTYCYLDKFNITPNTKNQNFFLRGLWRNLMLLRQVGYTEACKCNN